MPCARLRRPPGDYFYPLGTFGKLAGFELLHVVIRLPVVLLSFHYFGLPGVFVSLCVLQTVLWGTTTWSLREIIPLAPRHSQASSLKPYFSYGVSSWLTAVCNILQAQFSVYAIAAWVAAREAALLALAMQFYLLARGLYLPVQRSLMPLLSELESAGESARLRSWGSLMLRLSVALSCLLAISWALLGKQLFPLLFGPDFAPAYRISVVLFCSLTFLGAGLTCHTLLFVRSRAGLASLATVVHTVTILGGLAFVLIGRDGGGVTMGTAWVYFGASVLFAISSYAALRWRAGVHLPMGASLLLLLPTALAIPAIGWEAPWLLRILAVLAFMLIYAGFAVALKLVTPGEIGKILDRLRNREANQKTADAQSP